MNLPDNETSHHRPESEAVPVPVSSEKPTAANVSAPGDIVTPYQISIHISALAIFRHLIERLVLLANLELGVGAIEVAVMNETLKAPLTSVTGVPVPDEMIEPVMTQISPLLGGILCERNHPAYYQHGALDLVDITSSVAMALVRQGESDNPLGLRGGQPGDIQSDLMTRIAEFASMFTLSLSSVMAANSIDPARYSASLSSGVIRIFGGPMIMVRRSVISGRAFGNNFRIGVHARNVMELLATQKPTGRMQLQPGFPEVILAQLGYQPKSYMWSQTFNGKIEYHSANVMPVTVQDSQRSETINAVMDWFSRYPLKDGAAAVLKPSGRHVSENGDDQEPPEVLMSLFSGTAGNEATLPVAVAISFMEATRSIPEDDPIFSAFREWSASDNAPSVATKWMILTTIDRVARDMANVA